MTDAPNKERNSYIYPSRFSSSTTLTMHGCRTPIERIAWHSVLPYLDEYTYVCIGPSKAAAANILKNMCGAGTMQKCQVSGSRGWGGGK